MFLIGNAARKEMTGHEFRVQQNYACGRNNKAQVGKKVVSLVEVTSKTNSVCSKTVCYFWFCHRRLLP